MAKLCPGRPVPVYRFWWPVLGPGQQGAGGLQILVSVGGCNVERGQSERWISSVLEMSVGPEDPMTNESFMDSSNEMSRSH